MARSFFGIVPTRRPPRCCTPSDDTNSNSQADPTDRRVLVRRVLDLLRSEFAEQTWQAFWRTAVEGQPAVEAAEDLGMSPGAVRVAKCRVLQRLRAELGDALGPLG